ncbi:cerebellin 11 [Boleophthalmus pectinirostris]|uniref:cerebellin 11 n=1 Tax=Boleophthalmus pectinirostris TaxID=150288 RepID=UPI00242E8B7F|nr:cerebellin 11 [Boleophthalmus pectinirostris]
MKICLLICLALGLSLGQQQTNDSNVTSADTAENKNRRFSFNPSSDLYIQPRNWPGLEPVAFTATNPRQDPDGQIAFTDVVTNSGYAYDPNRGVFTAPLPGLYYFSFNVFIRGRSLGLFRNQEPIISSSIFWFNSAFGSNSAVVELNPGDEVYLSLWPVLRQIYPNNKSSSFSGYLIYSFY